MEDTRDTGSRLRRLARNIGPVALMAGMYVYSMERNHGLVPSWFDAFFSLAWGGLVIVGAVVIMRSNEKRFLVRVSSEKFHLKPGERLLTSGNLLSCEFYPDAVAFNPRPRFREWLRGHLIIWFLLWFRLTNERLAFGIIPRRTWRIIPLCNVVQVLEFHERWPYRNILLVEYEFEGRREAILLNTKFAKVRDLASSLTTAHRQ